MSITCPLCDNGEKPNTIKQHYWHCAHCDLIFLDPGQRLPLALEKDRYLKHNNVADAGFLEFLRPTVEKVIGLSPTSVLDYGSGPEPVLAIQLRQAGINVQIYDPFFAIDKVVLQEKYDVIVLHEVLEHIFDPAAELYQLVAMLNENGHVVIRTQLHQGPKHFENWWYARDPTHVCFFSARTVEYLRVRMPEVGMRLIWINA